MIKIVKTDKYLILFNMKNGNEILTGIGGNPDPFSLEYPSLIDVGVMGKCLNNCKICYQGTNNYDSNMSLENFKMIVDQSKQHVMQFACGGKGDFNHHENFKEMIEYCRENKIIVNYTTSGNSLTNEQVTISKLCGAVAVSDYDKPFTYSSLNRFMDAGIKTNIHFVLSTETFDRAMDILDGKDVWNGKFDILKLNAVIFLLFKPCGKSKGRYDLIPSNNQIKQFIKKIREIKVSFKLGMDSCLVNKLATLDNLTDKEKVLLDTCEASRASMYITPDMRAVPCSFADYETNGVLITPDNPIKKIWDESESFNRCRNFLKDCHENCVYKCPYMGKG